MLTGDPKQDLIHVLGTTFLVFCGKLTLQIIWLESPEESDENITLMEKFKLNVTKFPVPGAQAP